MKMRLLSAGLMLAALTITASQAHAKNILAIIVDDVGSELVVVRDLRDRLRRR